jgi:hypothetical protein
VLIAQFAKASAGQPAKKPTNMIGHQVVREHDEFLHNFVEH